MQQRAATHNRHHGGTGNAMNTNTATYQLSIGDAVTLNTPDNPRLHGQPATVHTLTEYGAIVHTKAAATGQFRAAFVEMANPRKDNKTIAAVEQGYTGDVCPTCGGCRMKRTGPCATCEDCGHNEGCG